MGINGPDPAYYWLTVEALDYMVGAQVDAGIYVDGVYAGTGYVSVQVIEGWYSVSADYSAWDPFWGTWSTLGDYSDGYVDGARSPIYSNTHLVAYYYFYY